MKKILVLLLTLAVSFPALAGRDKPITPDRLPAPAMEFITAHFGSAQISLATMDKEFLDTTYEVFFTDGNKIEFDKKGLWKEIDCKYSRIPAGALPKEIDSYISTKHPERYAKEIDRDKYDYEIRLDNGGELKFDLQFRFIGYDD